MARKRKQKGTTGGPAGSLLTESSPPALSGQAAVVPPEEGPDGSTAVQAATPGDEEANSAAPRAGAASRTGRRPPRRPLREPEEDDPDEIDDDYFADDTDEEEWDLPGLPTTVRDDDPDLEAFLVAVADGKTALPLADWLRERDDPRADLVEQLAAPQPVVPVMDADLCHDQPMVAAPQWSAARTVTGVVVRVYRGTLLYGFLWPRGLGETRMIQSLKRRTPELLLQAFEVCRVRLILSLFGTDRQHLVGRRTVRKSPRVSRGSAAWSPRSGASSRPHRPGCARGGPGAGPVLGR